MKTPKYMTMSEAFKCEDDDIPFVEGIYNTKCMLPKARLLKEDLRYLTIDVSLSVEWQVKKAEPKVLTAKEIENKFEDGSTVMDIIEYARQNYRLERDLELRPVIDALDKTLESIACEDQYQKTTAYKTLVACFENLKPLKTE